MLTTGNPAERLHDLLWAFMDNAASSVGVDTCWAQVLGVEASRVPVVLGDVLVLIPQTLMTLEALGMDRMVAICHRNTHSWSRPMLTRQNGSSGLIDVTALDQLESIATAIEHAGTPTPKIDAEKMLDLRTALEEAKESLLQAKDVDRDLRAVLLSRLSQMLWALDNISVKGADGVQEAMERLAAALATETTSEQRKKGTPLSKVVKALAVAVFVFSQGSDVQDDAEAWGQMVPEAVQHLQQLRPKEIEAAPSVREVEGPKADAELEDVG